MRVRVGVLLRVVGILVALPLALLLALNAFLNLWLPILVNQQPERIRMDFVVAWMLVPGEVEVRGLAIRQQSPNDQWLLTVDSATAEFALADFLDHTIHITTADAHGASFLWRARADAPQKFPTAPDDVADPGGAAAPDPAVPFTVVPAVVVDLTPPVPGFTNPPDPNPEAIYPEAKPWRIALEDVHVDRVREIWLGDYRYSGDATASGAMTLEAHKWLEVTGAVLELKGGAVTRGAEPMLTGLTGQVEVDLAGTNPESFEGAGLLGSVSGKVGITADVSNLSFLDFYLASAPWLHLTGGVGKLVVDVAVQEGSFQDGSMVSADVADIVARFLSYSVVGDGAVRLAVGVADGAPRTTIGVGFKDFAISLDGDAVPHVEGQGFRVDATTNDVALHRPFTSLNVVLDLPEAQIPDVAVYNAYLPHGIGLALQSGTGTVRGHLEVSTAQNECHGELFINGRAVRASLDELALRGDVAVHAVVPKGNLETGKYDVSGTSLDLKNVQVISGGSLREGKDDSSGWWAKISLPRGAVAVGAPTFLDGNIDVKFRDTIPFITIFSEKQPLPGWIRGLLAVRPVSGEARLRLGDDVLRISDFQLFAGQFEVLLELRRRQEMLGKAYIRFGQLSLGMGLGADKKTHVQVFNAKKWYDAEPDPS